MLMLLFCGQEGQAATPMAGHAVPLIFLLQSLRDSSFRGCHFLLSAICHVKLFAMPSGGGECPGLLPLICAAALMSRRRYFFFFHFAACRRRVSFTPFD